MEENNYSAETNDFEDDDIIDNQDDIEEVAETQDDADESIEHDADRSDAEFEDSADEPEEVEEVANPDKKEEAQEKKPQSKEENAKFAAQRRAKELEAEKLKAKYEGIKEALGGMNPFTDEPIEDEHDIEEYLAMKKLNSEGKDPIADYHKFQKEKAREAEKATKAKETEEQTQIQAQEDWREFQKAYPKVTLDELQKDEAFVEFSEEKIGKKPLKDIYTSYVKLTERIRAKEEESEKVRQARNKASVGSLKEKGTPVAKTIETMSDAEMEKLIKKAKAGKL